MRSGESLRHWVAKVLPGESEFAQEAGWQLLRALLQDFTVSLCGLARQLERGGVATSGRQYLFRWLSRPRWEPLELYRHLPQCWPQPLRRAATIPLLIDCTVLGEQWNVLQVSIPWNGRALPLYRAVVNYREPEAGQTQLLWEALAWLRLHLPGPQSRYVIVVDRGFPSHALIRHLQEQRWRYVLRIGGNWRLTHPRLSALLEQAGQALQETGRNGKWFGGGVLGRRGKGRDQWSQTAVALYWRPGNQEVWYLATSERSWQAAARIYRQRMQIEAAFRDVKGPNGIDHLRHWTCRDRVSRLLAWLAIYEWRLASLFVKHALKKWSAERLQIGGALSWITATRTWVKRHWQLAIQGQTPVRESP